jgi:hypothetical protein
MAYSRYGKGSHWYTYWTGPVMPSSRDDALFEVHLITRFTSKQIRDDIDACLEQVRKLEPESIRVWWTVNPGERQPATDTEMEDLRKQMIEFLADVDGEYPA